MLATAEAGQWGWLIAGKPIAAAIALAVLWMLEAIIPMFPERDGGGRSKRHPAHSTTIAEETPR